MSHILNLSIAQFIASSREKAHVADQGFCISELTYRPQLDHPFQASDYSCCICLKGEARGTIGLIPYELKTSSMSIIVPGQLLEQHNMSKDFHAMCICMSKRFVKSLGVPYNFNLDKLLRQHPVIHLSTSQLESMMSYCHMVIRLLSTDHPFQTETLHHLTCAFFYGLGSYLYKVNQSMQLSAEEEITRRFLDTLSIHFRKEHKVGYYASYLHITHGYLSTAVKSITGKTPIEWIGEYIAKEACALMRSSSLNVQQISLHLGFSSQSFFGKYFKRIMGCTPTDYMQKGKQDGTATVQGME
ncbi:MAG: helix-turn-helix domain-containing protein [Prevotella sp.]